MFSLAALIFFISAIFCLGVTFGAIAHSLRAKKMSSGLRRFLVRVAGYVGYIAAFGIGVFLTTFFEIGAYPYHYYRWAGLMDDVTVGSVINDNPEIMETGVVPQDVRDWYARMKEEGIIE